MVVARSDHSVVASLTPRQFDEGMFSGLTRDDRSNEVPKLILWRKKRRLFFVIIIVYHVSEHTSSIFKDIIDDTSKNK